MTLLYYTILYYTILYYTILYQFFFLSTCGIMIVYNHIVTECGITLVWGGHVKFWYSDEPPQNEQQKQETNAAD